MCYKRHQDAMWMLLVVIGDIDHTFPSPKIKRGENLNAQENNEITSSRVKQDNKDKESTDNRASKPVWILWQSDETSY